MAGMDSAKEWWEGLPPERKRIAIICGLAGAVIGTGLIVDSSTTPPQRAAAVTQDVSQMSVVAPGVTDNSAQAIAAEVNALSRKLGENERDQGLLASQSDETRRLADELKAKQEELSQLDKSVDQVRQELVLMKSGLADPAAPLAAKIELPALDPSPSMAMPDISAPAMAPVQQPKRRLRIIDARSDSSGSSGGFGAGGIGMGDVNNGLNGVASAIAHDVTPAGQVVVTPGGSAGQVSNAGTVAQDTAAAPATFIPAGSIIEGVLLNGMDAPTSGVANKNPVPALLRVAKEAILPNRFRENVRECFVIVAGEGELSSERVKMRSETISCVRVDGGIIEAAIDGYVTGEDGKVGMRGRLVSKQGSILAKTFVSGLASGIAQVMTPQSVPQLSLSTSGTYQTVQPNLGDAGQAGLYQGLSQSANQLSKFWLDMAQQMFPVLEVDAGRKATLILVRGTYLSLKPRGEM